MSDPNFLDQLRKQIAPFVLRRTKSDVLSDLPDKTEINILCPLSDLQKQEYQRIANLAIKQYGNDLAKTAKESPIKLFSILTRLRQICCDPNLLPWINSHSSQSGKLNVLFEKLEECFANKQKIVIFSQFVSLLKNVKNQLYEHFNEVPFWELIGSTLDREKPVSEFQKAKGPALILISLKAGGTGITLHSANTLFLLDPWWNPATENQAIDRIHRIGQSKEVFVYRLLTAGTIEQRIQMLKTEKSLLFNKVVGNSQNTAIPIHHFKSLSELIQLE